MDTQEFQKLVLNWMERVDNRLGSLEQDVSWIKGKMEGRTELSSMQRANLTIGISIVVGIGLLINWLR